MHNPASHPLTGISAQEQLNSMFIYDHDSLLDLLLRLSFGCFKFKVEGVDPSLGFDVSKTSYIFNNMADIRIFSPEKFCCVSLWSSLSTKK